MIEKFLVYIQFEKRTSLHTVSAYKADLLQFSEFLAAQDTELKSESAIHFDIRNWIISLMENNINPVSINRKIATLRSYYKFLCRSGFIENNPTLKINALKSKKKLPQTISFDETTKLLCEIQFADDYSGVRDKLVLELLYGTGIRLSELLGLTNQNINLYESVLKVIGKRNKERVIPVNKSLKTLMQRYIDLKNACSFDNPLFFLNDTGEPLYAKAVYRIVKKYLSLVTTVEKKSPHVLRHTFATHLLDEGADLNAIKELLGHSNLAATQVYTHNSFEKIRMVFNQAHPKA